MRTNILGVTLQTPGNTALDCFVLIPQNRPNTKLNPGEKDYLLCCHRHVKTD